MNMTGGTHIRAVGPEAAQEAQTATDEVDGTDTLNLEEDWESEGEESYIEEEVLDYTAADHSWLIPAMAFALVAGWTGIFVWSIYSELMAGSIVSQWISWISTWSLPVLLICTVWLLAMRNSKVESARFSDTARKLNDETADLEAKLNTINRELSLAREFLGSQSRELESFGRVASERLSNHAETLQTLVKDNGDQVQAIAEVSETALGNMEKLRDDLPVIANSTRDVSSQIGNAGNTAEEQLQGLVKGFERLNEFGKASDQQVQSVTGKVDDALASFETQLTQLDEISASRFGALKEKSEEFRTDLDSREVDALAAMHRRADEVKTRADELLSEFADQEDKSLDTLRNRIEELKQEVLEMGPLLVKSHEDDFAVIRQSKERLFKELSEVAGSLYAMDEKAAISAKERMEGLYKEANRFDEILAARDAKFEKEMANRQEKFETRENNASQELTARLRTLDEALSGAASEHIAHTQQLVSQGEEIAGKLAEFNALIETTNDLSKMAKTEFSDSLDELAERISANEANLGTTKATLSELTEDGIRLLEIIQSGAQHSREDLPKAITIASDKLAEIETRASDLHSVIATSNKLGSDLSAYVLSSVENVQSFDNSIEQASANFANHNDNNLAQINNLKKAVAELNDQNTAMASDAHEQLSGAIAKLDEATKSAFASLESGIEDGLNKSSNDMSEQAIKALENSIQKHSEDAILRLEAAATKAASTGRETAVQLRNQLAKVDELAGNLEQRVTRSRDMAEEQINHDFARRMALITDSLNSNAIDISESLSADVTDTAWAAYLKGDRGIFTRRAVSLVTSAEARELTELYEVDETFRNHVNRFIHDFEGMLRSLLSTRDGNALGVTVLGSDMGKLYVALAQAIDRLRN